MPPEIAARIAAGQELRRRGKLTPEQDAALAELERRYSAAGEPDPSQGTEASPLRLSGSYRPAEADEEPPADAGRVPRDPRPVSLARQAGQQFGEQAGPVMAAVQGAGSMMFGIGTPATAVGKYIDARLSGRPVSFTDAMEFARGVREGTWEAHPGAQFVGGAAGLFAGGGVVREGVRRSPAVVRNVFSLRNGQTVRNILRLSGTGAAAAGVTAGMQEGADAVGPAAGFGAVAGPVFAGAAHGAVGAARAVGSRLPSNAVTRFLKIDPDNAAIRTIARRLRVNPDVVARRYDEFRETMGRSPSMVELMEGVEAGRLGAIGRRISSVGRVLREADEAALASRPAEMRRAVEVGGPSTTVPRETAALEPITEATRAAARAGGPQPTVGAQIRRRNERMDEVMERIGNQRVYLSDNMRDVVEHPDVQSALPAALRRRINNAIEQGETIGTIDLSIRTWDMMRQALSGRSGAGAGKIYSRLRDKIRDYVGERVPEYSMALQEFGQRTTAARATQKTVREVATASARDFAEFLRYGEGTRHAGQTSLRAARARGARFGVRQMISNQLSGTPQQAERFMTRLARDRRLQENIRRALTPDEVQRLEELGAQYGRQLNLVEGVQAGRRVVPKGDAETFRDAVQNARAQPGGAQGVEQGARGAIAGAVSESPGAAVGAARALSEPGAFIERIATALGPQEASRLRRVGQLATRSAENLRAAAPQMSQAQQEAAEKAAAMYDVISAAIVAPSPAFGPMKANLARRLLERVRLGRGVATRVAEMAVSRNPDEVASVIRRLRGLGMTEDEILRWYRDSAVAAGVLTGSSQ